MSKLVVTLIGMGNEVVGRVNIKLEDLPEGYTILPDVQLIEVQPCLVRGVQLNGVPTEASDAA